MSDIIEQGPLLVTIDTLAPERVAKLDNDALAALLTACYAKTQRDGITITHDRGWFSQRDPQIMGRGFTGFKSRRSDVLDSLGRFLNRFVREAREAQEAADAREAKLQRLRALKVNNYPTGVYQNGEVYIHIDDPNFMLYGGRVFLTVNELQQLLELATTEGA